MEVGSVLPVGRGCQLLACGVNGDTIAFYSNRTYEVWRINADGSNLGQLTDTTGYGFGLGDWSPDGRAIAAYEPVSHDLFMIDATRALPDRAPLRIGSWKDAVGYFVPIVWSADGSWIAGGNRGVVLYSVKEKKFRR